MKDYIEERAIGIANYIIDHNATVRQTARPSASKSTVHKDDGRRLAQVNPALAKQARKVLDVNKSERHIRGGLATREKYLTSTRYSMRQIILYGKCLEIPGTNLYNGYIAIWDKVVGT